MTAMSCAPVLSGSSRSLTPLRGVAFLAALLVMALSVMGGGIASAHTGFESSSPAAGDVVDVPVEVVTIVFTGEATPVGDRFIALNAAGVVQEPQSIETLDDKTFTVRFDPPLAGGEIGVRWKVAAADTHPIEGAFSFTVSAPVPATAPPSTVPATLPPETTDTAPTDTTPTGIEEAAAELGVQPSVEPPAEAAAEAAVTVAAPMADTAVLAEATVATLSLDEFLAVDDSAPGSSLATTGRLVGLLGVVLGLGGLALLGAALRGTRAEIRRGLRAVRVLGVVIVVGAVIEYFGVARILDRSVTSTWSVAPGLATVLRMAGGVAVAVGLTNTISKVSAATPARTLSAAVVEDRGATSTEPSGSASFVRWVPDATSWLAAVGVVAILGSFWFDGHTVSQGFRPLHALVNTVHIAAGAVWVGGVVALAAVAWTRHRAGESGRMTELVLRFSKIASIALGAVVVAGGVMAILVLDSFGELTGTPWGKILLLKTAAVAIAATGGAYNHFRLLPALEAEPESSDRLATLRSTLTAEAVMLLFVVAVTAWLVAAAS